MLNVTILYKVNNETHSHTRSMTGDLNSAMNNIWEEMIANLGFRFKINDHTLRFVNITSIEAIDITDIKEK